MLFSGNWLETKGTIDPLSLSIRERNQDYSFFIEISMYAVKSGFSVVPDLSCLPILCL